MNRNQKNLLITVIVLGVVIWSVWSAIQNGVFQSQSFGDYFILPYVLLIGLIFAAVALVKSTEIGMISISMLIFFACGSAFSSIDPKDFNAESLSWATMVCGYLTAAAGFTALAAFNKIDNKR
ncbi:MAG: hypothetical protein ACYC27_06540 [Armatimonadota bacterium]